MITAEPPEHNVPICSGLIGSIPHHPFIEKKLNTILKNKLDITDKKAVLTTSGPLTFTDYEGDIIPYCNLMGVNDKQKLSKECTEKDIYTFTLWNEGTGWGV